MVLSKVKSCQGAGDWSNEHGTFYKFEYTMEDGAVLTASHKKQEGFPIGASVEYEIKGTNEHGSYGSVKKPDSGNFNSNASKTDPKVQGMIVKQNALGHATELLKHNSIMDGEGARMKASDVMALAQVYTDWVMGEKPEQTQTEQLMDDTQN